jgi:hypothetical protein
MRRMMSSWLSTIAKLGFQRRSHCSKRIHLKHQGGYSRRPRLESLEDRLALSVSYDGPLIDNGPLDRRIDLVFLGDGFVAEGESEDVDETIVRYREKVDELVEGLENGVKTLPDFFDASPFDEYASYFNVHRVDVTSAQPGIDPSIFDDAVDTALDGYLYGDDNRFGLGGTTAARDAVLSTVGDWDLVQIIFNAVGRANAEGLVGSSHEGIGHDVNVHLHEVGHSLGQLADEYFPSNAPPYSGGEPAAPNLTAYTKQEMLAGQLKWYRWLDDPNHTDIDAHPGGGGDGGSPTGIFRPSDSSRMRNHNQDFSVVDKEALIIKIYKQEDINAIDYATAEGTYYFGQEFTVTPMQPTSHDLDIQWYLDDIPISGATEEVLDTRELSVTPGEHTIKVVVVDNTPMVRDDNARAAHMTATREWTWDTSGIVVTTEADENDGYDVGDISLRDAIDFVANQTGVDTVAFDPSVESILLTEGQLVIDSDVSIVGSGASQLSVSGNNQSRVMVVNGGVTASVSGVTLTNGYSAGDGGAIFNSGVLTLHEVMVVNSQSGFQGGGIHSQNGASGVASLRLINSTIDNNRAVRGAGLNIDAGGGVLEILGTTISNNRALDGFAFAVAGGLRLSGTAASTISILNSTIANNQSSFDGGISVWNNSAPITIVNSTIADNVGNVGGGIDNKSAGSLITLHNTIVARNTTNANSPSDTFGSFNTSSSHNLIGTGASGLSTLMGNLLGDTMVPIDPELTVLGDHGGLTQTIGFLTGSPAIDAGSNSEANNYLGNPANDQRGYTRYFDDPLTNGMGVVIDMGAYEYSTARIMNVTIGSTTENPDGTNQPYSFDTVVGSEEQMRTVPVGSANRISIQFSKDVNVTSSDLELIALNRMVTEPIPTLIQEPTSLNAFTAAWALSTTLPDAQYLLRLSDSIIDLDGFALDGEWINPASILSSATTKVFPSGDNIAGEDFEFVFTYLRGDANRDLQVTDSDLSILLGHLNQGGNKSWNHGDFTGDGTVADGDLSLLFATLNKSDWRDLQIRGDYDGDFDIDGNDQTDFLAFYAAGGPAANLNADSIVDEADANVFASLQGLGVDLNVNVATIDFRPPKVTNVTISSTAANPYGTNQPYSFDSVDGSEEQLRTVPVGSANRISVQFTRDVDVSSSDLELIALNRVVMVPIPTLVEEPTGANGYTATWSLPSALPDAQYLLRLSDSIQDLDGNALDGEWVNPGSVLSSVTTTVFPSGDSVAGGDFEFVFTYLRGDANRDLQVTDSDLSILLGHLNQGGNKSWNHGDFTGDGTVADGDLSLLLATLNKSDWRDLRVSGDYDGDFKVNETDENLFLLIYDPLNYDPAADLDGDLDVDIDDFDLFYEMLGRDIDLSVVV